MAGYTHSSCNARGVFAPFTPNGSYLEDMYVP